MKKLLLFLLWSLPFAAFAQGWQWGVGSSCKMGYFESAPITVDRNGNTFEVGGYSYHFSLDSLISIFGADTVIDSQGLDYQSIVVSADSNGHYRWALGVQGGYASFSSIKADKYGNVYIAGASQGYFRLGTKSCNDSNFIAKINTAGDVVWIRSFTPGRFYFRALSIDSSGEIYVAGEYRLRTFTLGGSVLTNADTSGFTSDIFYARLDTSGNVLWARSFGGNSVDDVSDMVAAGNNAIYIAGDFASDTMKIGHNILQASPGSPQLYVARFKDSSAVWGRAVNAWSSTYFGINAITADGNDNVYATGQYSFLFIFGGDTLVKPADLGDISAMFLLKYDSSGKEKWARSIVKANEFSNGYSVVTDSCMVWVSGSPFETATGDRMFLAEYDTTGRFVDTLMLPAGGDDRNAIVTDHKGNLYVGGDYYNYPFVVGHDTLGLTDASQEALFILKYRFGPKPCAFEAVEPVNKTPPGYTLFPNPTDAVLTVSAADKITSITVTNLFGQTILSRRYDVAEVQLDVSKFPAGVYLVRINGTEVRKFLKE